MNDSPRSETTNLLKESRTALFLHRLNVALWEQEALAMLDAMDEEIRNADRPIEEPLYRSVVSIPYGDLEGVMAAA